MRAFHSNLHEQKCALVTAQHGARAAWGAGTQPGQQVPLLQAVPGLGLGRDGGPLPELSQQQPL